MTITETDQATPEQIANARTRAELVANLHRFADALADHPDLPLPSYGMCVTAYVNEATARAGRRELHGWVKLASPESAYTTYEKTFGSEAYDRSAVTYTLEISKSESCRRVVVGKRHVKAVRTKAHDEDVYGWECGDTEDAGES